MDDVAKLLLELGALVLGISVLGLIAHRLRLSPIPFILIAGIAFGTGGIIDIQVAEPFIHASAEIGVLLLLLTLGLEFTSAELVESMKKHRFSGLIDFALNATPGFVLGLVFGMELPAALALAGITWVSSSGIIARLITDLGRLANRETPVVLSILVIEDVMMAAFLPILLVVLSGGTWWQAIGGVALALGAVAFILLASARGGDQLRRLLSHPNDEQVLLRLLGLTLLVAGVTQLLGASAAVGAFLVGIAVPSSIADRARTLLSPLRDLFAAIFFLSFGLPIAPESMLPVLPIALVLAAVSIVSKMSTGWIASARVGVGRKGRLRAGAVLVARGEFSIVIAALAVEAGYDVIGPIATTYVLVLAIVAPILARFIVRAPKREVPMAVEGQPDLS